ncbi:hypothetical protein J4W73_04650, partial [Escherichia coli]
GSFAAFWLHNNKGRLTRGCNPAYSKSIHTWLRFGEIMRGSLRALRQQNESVVRLMQQQLQQAVMTHSWIYTDAQLLRDDIQTLFTAERY